LLSLLRICDLVLLGLLHHYYVTSMVPNIASRVAIDMYHMALPQASHFVLISVTSGIYIYGHITYLTLPSY
jgi:hypothetical protein